MLVLPVGRSTTIVFTHMAEHTCIRGGRASWYHRLRMRYFPSWDSTLLANRSFRVGIPVGPYELQMWRAPKQEPDMSTM